MSRKRQTAMLPPALCYPELYNDLQDMADRLNLSKGEIIRRAVRIYLRKQHQKLIVNSSQSEGRR